MQPAVGAQGDGRLRIANLLQRSAVVQVFLAVPFSRRNPPGGGLFGDVELGELLADADLAQLGLVGELVPEAHAVVVEAEHHLVAARWRSLLGKGHPQLVVVVAHLTTFAPGLFPGLVEAARRLAGDDEVAFELGCIQEQEAEPRRRDHRLAMAQDRVAGPAVVVGGHHHLEGAVRRSMLDAGLRWCGPDRAAGQQHCKRDERHQANRHGWIQAVTGQPERAFARPRGQGVRVRIRMRKTSGSSLA